MLQLGRSHSLVCMHALYYIILLEKSGVLQTCQHCNEQEYNSIQQTELAVKKYFHIAKQLYLHYFNLKPLLLQKPALGNVIKDINWGGHRVTLPVRGPAKIFFFYKVRWPLYSCVFGATATSLMVPKIVPMIGKCQSSPVDIGL